MIQYIRTCFFGNSQKSREIDTVIRIEGHEMRSSELQNRSECENASADNTTTLSQEFVPKYVTALVYEGCSRGPPEALGFRKGQREGRDP